MGRASNGVLSLTPHYYRIRGRAAEIARALGSPVGGAEHLFLGMLHDGGWPVSVISPVVDLDQAEAVVLDIMSSPGYSAPPAPRFPARNGFVQPWGAKVAIEMGDAYIGRAAIAGVLPEGATFGFNWDTEHRAWISVFGAGGCGPAVTRQVLNTALASLGRPSLGS